VPGQIGRFEVRRLLGEGAFGRVYEAYDPSLKRPVALKVAKRGDERGVERFLREARAAGVLMHQNIVAVYDSGHEGDQYFIASAFVPGRPLSAVVEEGRSMPHREAAEVARKLAEALAYAHKQGVIHRDVKPGNVILRDDGEPLLMDFGIAARSDEDSKLTVAGQFMGTPAYAAPEQWQGHACAASDQYALGCLLFELLMGQVPFAGSDPGHYLVLHTQAPVPAMPGVPSDLETIVRKCLEKEAEKRYPDCQELADDLARFLRGEPTRARPVGPLGKLWRWARREPGTASLVGAVALLLLIATALSWALTSWALGEKGRADVKAEDAKNSAALAKQREKEAKANEALANKRQEAANYQAFRVEDAEHAIQIGLAFRAWERYDVARAEQALGEVLPRFRQAWETRHLRGLCRRRALALLGHKGTVWCVAFSPDGGCIASADANGAITVWDASTGKEKVHLKGHTKAVWGVVYSPDGRRIASASDDNTVRVWDALTGEKLLELEGHIDGALCVAFSPDGKRIASGDGDTSVRVWDAQTGRKVLSFQKHGSRTLCVAFSPDGNFIASGGLDRSVRIWDAHTGQEQLHLKGHTGGVSAVAYSPDGKRVVSASWDNSLKVWNAETGKELITLNGHKAFVSSVAYSPDGRRIVSASGDNTVKVWDAEAWHHLFSFRGHGNIVLCVAFSPDGNFIASAGRGQVVRLWDLEGGQEMLSLRGLAGEATGVAVSPDGRWAAGGGQGRVLKVWDALTGEEARSLKGHAERVSCVAYTPNGGLIVSASWDCSVKVWDARTGREKRSLEGHLGPVRCVAVSPDGKRAVSGGADILNPENPGEVKVWDIQTGKEVLNLKGHAKGVWCVAYSPDGSRIVSGGLDRTLKVWDALTGKELHALKGHTDGATGVAYSPDGRRIASGSLDGTVRVWDAQAGELVLSLKGHTGFVLSVAYSSDGARIASGGADNTLKVWAARTGQQMLSLKGPSSGGVTGVAFSPEGRRIFGAIGNEGQPGEVAVWDAEGEELAQDIQAERTRRQWACRRWHADQAARWETAKQWPAAAFHLERLHRCSLDSHIYQRLLVALEKADDTPLTQALAHNVQITEAARAASAVANPWLALPLLRAAMPPR
jgi:WD40 repeat protein/predicted Ser/Thr protein kinase